eukprot:5471406-Pleurochrysis_carterae.AAC.1
MVEYNKGHTFFQCRKELRMQGEAAFSACSAVKVRKGTSWVRSSHSTMPKLSRAHRRWGEARAWVRRVGGDVFVRAL